MARVARCRQPNASFRLQHRKRLQAPGELRRSAGIDKAELRAELARERGATLEGALPCNELNPCPGLGRLQRLKNLVLEPHAVDFTPSALLCSARNVGAGRG